ncbi:Gis3p [Saccharomyces eubayanus]|uniref:Gis3p n=1 Tax=Saccharomyces eubayanus TaxID=1080349 RepID=UPI0006C48F5F|nr:GIS3-like protein [Saccharomyces eubayanus]KOG97806.1 GIS3-like protein [Saccharomyces eubayanus]
MLLNVETNHSVMHGHEHRLIGSMRNDSALHSWNDSSKVFYPKSFYATATNKKNNKLATASLNKTIASTRTVSDQSYFCSSAGAPLDGPAGSRSSNVPTKRKSFKRTRILKARVDSEMSNENRSSFMTPSLSSVLSQVKKSNSVKTVSGDCPIHENLLTQSIKRKFSEETQSDCSSLGSSKDHPLTDNIAEAADAQTPAIDDENQIEAEAPKIKILNMKDLDLFDDWEVKDLVDLFPPVYERHSQPLSDLSPVPSLSDASAKPRPTSVDFQIVNKTGGASRRKSKSKSTTENMIYENDLVELEQWPSTTPSSETKDAAAPNDLLLPNKRIRQKSLNTNFLKLYSIETSCKRKNILPEVEVDDHLLKQLTYSDIWSLEIKKEPKVSTRDIKIALITRKKLWSDMVHETRNDLFGDSTPWNLPFIATASTVPPAPDHEPANEPGTMDPKSSLVRVHSDVKPWFNNRGTMLKPCGKLSLGKVSNKTTAPTRDIQYVVKGWCDARFV